MSSPIVQLGKTATAQGANRAGAPPLIAHIIHRLDIGGLENGLVNLINQIPPERFRHAIICMKDYTDFSQRIQQEGVTLHALHKREGQDLSVHGRLWRLLRRLKPAIVHTRNMATLEMQVTAFLAGVQGRVHGEHGWDMADLDGSRLKSRLLRRLFRPFVNQYIVLSRHQLHYLPEQIGVSVGCIDHICNGVDTHRFHPAVIPEKAVFPPGFAPPGTLVIGAVMRMQPVKAPEVLVKSFLSLLEQEPKARDRLRLVMIGDGPLLPALREQLAAAGAMDLAWLPGAREDVPDLLRAMDIFVLPSLAEGICNTVLEAMASGLPVIASRVGGNPDLVTDRETGRLIPAASVDELTMALRQYLHDPVRIRTQGDAARMRAEQVFGLDAMVDHYMSVYDRLLRISG